MIVEFKHTKAFAAALLALAIAVICVSCTEMPKPENTVTEAPATEAPLPEETQEAAAMTDREAAHAAYREVVSNAEAYDYGAGEDMPVSGYRYALVNMQSGDSVPTLLLAQTLELGVEYVRVFRYDPQTGKVLEPVLPGDGVLMQGDASAGGFRGEISVLEDGAGLCAYEFYSLTGDGVMRRISAEGDALVEEQLAETNVTEKGSIAVFPIVNWYDVSDLSGLAD